MAKPRGLRRDTPPDPAVELRHKWRLRRFMEATARPRQDHPVRSRRSPTLAARDQRQRELEAAAAHRRSWLADHAGSFAYRDELARQVAARRAAQLVNALVNQPAHRVELLGPLPADDVGEERWASRAGRIEAYREQWGVAPDKLRVSPADGVCPASETERRNASEPVVEPAQVWNRLQPRKWPLAGGCGPGSSER